MKFKCKHCKSVNTIPGYYCEFCGKKTGFSKKKYAVPFPRSQESFGETNASFPTGDEVVRAFTHKKKKAPIILSLLLVLCLLSGTVGAGWHFGWFPFSNQDTAPLRERYFRMADGRRVETVVLNSTAALTAVNEVKEDFGIQNADSELAELHHTTIDGDHYYRLQQTYQGLDVYGRSMVVETNSEGKVFFIAGNFCPVRDLSLTPGIQADKANKKLHRYALKEMNYSEDTLSVIENGLVVYAPNENDAKLAYSYRLSGASEDGTHQSHLILLSAKNGTPLFSTETKHSFSISLEGQRGMHQVEVEGSLTDYQFVDTTRNIQVYSTEDLSLSAIEVIRSSSTANKLIATDALYYAGEAYDFYREVLGRNSYDNNGGALNIITDLPESTHIYDGASAFGTSIVFYPKATKLFHSSAAPDIVAHEFTHLVTDHTVGFPMGEEASAITESFADILGNIIEQAQRETPDETWALGEGTGTAKYEMAAPSKNGYPESVSAFDPTASVHSNSSILSHVAFLIWQGTSFGDFSIEDTAITDLNLLGKLWYRTMLLLPQDADFSSCGALLLESGYDMYRNGSLTAPQLTGILLSLEAVGIIPDYLTYEVTQNSTLAVYDAINTNYSDISVSVTDLSTYQTITPESTELTLAPGSYLVTVSHKEDTTLPSYTVKIIVGEFGQSEIPVYTWYNAKDYIDISAGSTLTFTGTLVGENRVDETGETKLSWVLALPNPVNIRFMNESGHAESIYHDQVALAITSDLFDLSLYTGQEITVSGSLVLKYSDIHLRDLVLENASLITNNVIAE